MRSSRPGHTVEAMPRAMAPSSIGAPRFGEHSCGGQRRERVANLESGPGEAWASGMPEPESLEMAVNAKQPLCDVMFSRRNSFFDFDEKSGLLRQRGAGSQHARSDVPQRSRLEPRA